MASSDGDIRLWDAADGRLARTLAGGGGAVESVAFSPNGQFLASGAEDGSINLWNVSTGVSAASVVAAPGSAARVAYSPDGAVVAFGSASGPVGLWQVTTGHVNYPLTGHVGAVTDLAFSPAGGFLVSASLDGTIRLWQVGSGQALGVIRDTGGAVASLVFQPTTGRYLLSFAYDGSFRAWDLAGLRLLQACTDNAELVADVTVPSDPVVPPGVPVQKVWRVRNTGSCAWSARYQLVFVSGVPMGAASPQPLADVAPGGILDIVLNVVAPLPPGPYLGIWQMVNPDGQAFGPALSVVVQSGVPAPAVYITASATNINAGGSVTVQATAVGTVQAWLDGELMVNGFAQKTVWLCGDTTFTVVGLLPDGQYISQSVLVTVNGSCGGNEADLEIKELTANTTQPNVGEVVHFSARIKNEGDADADDFDSRVAAVERRLVSGRGERPRPGLGRGHVGELGLHIQRGGYLRHPRAHRI